MRRVKTAPAARTVEPGHRPKATIAEPPLLQLQRSAGNQATTLVVQRAKSGELKPGDDVQFVDDGTELRGIFVREEREEDELYAVVNITHAGGKTTDAWGEYRARLSKVEKAGTGPVPQLPRPQGGFKITHFHKPETGVTAAEYIKPHGKWREIGPAANAINITQHGLGSGIYGLAKPTEEQGRAARDYDGSIPAEITLQNPLYLQSARHGELLTELSKNLQRVAEAIRDENKGLTHYAVKGWFKAHQGELGELADQMGKVFALLARDEKDPERIERALFDFFVGYHVSDIVAQPINFLLTGFGYDGIYAENPSDNSFTRGCVAFTVPKEMKKTTRADRLVDAERRG